MLFIINSNFCFAGPSSGTLLVDIEDCIRKETLDDGKKLHLIKNRKPESTVMFPTLAYPDK